MTADRLAEHQPKPYPWPAHCRVCRTRIAVVPGTASWVQATCFNWRANREIAPDRKCPLYGKMQTVHRS